MTTPAAAAFVALFALGANFLGTVLLLLLSRASREVRWYAAFSGAVMVWLALQGTSLLLMQVPSGLPLYGAAVHLMPTLFLAAALVQAGAGTRRVWPPWAVLAAGALLLVLGDPLRSWPLIAWQVLGWTAAAAVYLLRSATGRGRRLGVAGSSRSEKGLEALLSGMVPLGVAGAILIKGGFVLFVLPLLTVAVQLLIFVGIVHHRYYDIEVRIERTGALIASAAERDRLALLGEIAATMAHEIRNPLTGIRSLTQMMAESPTDSGRRSRYTAVILGEIDRLDRIVGNLTELARRGENGAARPVEAFDLRTLVDDLVLLAGPRARASGVTLQVDVPGQPLATARDAVAQALLNLLLNAIEHAPPDSAVDVRAAPGDGGIVLSVRDRGPGIAPEDRERVFEPFHSTGGTGLGLAVVRRLARQHGWGLAVLDAPDGGAEFRISFPRADTVE